MIARWGFGLLLLALLLGTIPAVAAEATGDSTSLTEFANGLRLLVLPRPNNRLVQVDVYLSLRGATHRRDLPHLVEHLMFRSSENCPAGSLRDSMQLLATNYNGFTNSRNIRTRTRCLPRFLPRLIAVEAERFGRLRPDQSDLEYERHRVLGEHEFRQEVSTRWALNRRLTSMAYEAEDVDDHLLTKSEVIRAVTLADVDTFLTRWFRPERTVVLVSGPVVPDSVVAATRATFGTLAANGEEPVATDRPPRPEPRHFVTRTQDRRDVLAVGFRLPYGTLDEVAVVHLAETIMDRENGHPSLSIYEDEALLVIYVWGNWSTNHTDEEGAARALRQFWSETQTVQHRVREDWVFERNRAAHVKNLRKRMTRPYRHAAWRAQQLADNRDLPPPVVMAAMVDSLDQAKIHEFFTEQFTAARAHTAFAAGRAKRDMSLSRWNRNLRLRVNPYRTRHRALTELGVTDIAPVLAAAAATGIGRSEMIVLENGLPVHILEVPAADDVYLGGVRTFPFLEDEAASRDPGRLILYEWLANVGYDNKGSNIAPRGDRPGWHTEIDAYVSSLLVKAHGPRDRFKKVAAAMHKRIAVDKLNGYAFRARVDSRAEWISKLDSYPLAKAWSWRMQRVLGPEHPLVGWQQPDADCLVDWSIGKANKLHRKLCRTGNFQLVVTGDVDVEAVRATLAPDFSRLDKAEPTTLPFITGPKVIVEGTLVPNDNSSVAVCDFLFSPQPLAAEPVLGAVDLMVLARLFETRLGVAAEHAGLDSVKVAITIVSAGASVLPRIDVVSRPGDAGRILALVGAEAARLQDQQPTADEVARARLQLVGPILETMLSAKGSRNWLLYWGEFGEIPANPLGDLCHPAHDIVAARAAGLFPADQYVWTVTGAAALIDTGDFRPVTH